jgi:microcystin-dependent protein
VGTPYLGEIKMTAFNFPPKGWAQCNGQLMPINQNQALFSLFGTTYGGNGQTTFALPDLRGAAAMHRGAGFTQGEHGGEEGHTVTLQEMAAHTHALMASTTDGNTQAPSGNVLARNTNNIYGQAQNLTQLNPSSTTNVGGTQPHSNMQPYLCINFIVALIGVFPSRN